MKLPIDEITPDSEQEIWVDVQGYSGLYEVSNMGRVRSYRLQRSSKKRIVEPYIMSPNVMRDGYLGVRFSKNASREYRAIHRLVLETFVGSCPKKHECAHLNGNKSDNRLSNLRWVLPSENYIHRLLHGTDNTGVKNGRAKLNEEDVHNIRILIGRLTPNKEIANMYKISTSTVDAIKHGKIWRHVK